MAISKGKAGNEYYVVFSSKTLPENITHKYLPLPIKENATLPIWFRNYNCAWDVKPDEFGYYDILRLPCADVLWKVFVKMTLVNDKLVNAQPFYAHEIQHGSSHFGGGMVTLPDGRILYGVGDCLPPGTNGRRPSQDMNSHCGKILLIDPDEGTAEVALKGIRNPQVMTIHEDKLMWADIGGVSAEEINSICVKKVIDTSIVENFGWGMKDDEDFAREGTFKVARGTPFGDGQPECLGYLDKAEKKGFYDPVVQFSRRGPNIPFYGVASMVVSPKSFKNFEILATDFYSGEAIVTKNNNCEYDQRGFNITVVNENDQVMFDGFNGLNRDFLNFTIDDTTKNARGDPRLFLFSDKRAGVFIERTGHFYSLEEVTTNYVDSKNKKCQCRKFMEKKPKKCEKKSQEKKTCKNKVNKKKKLKKKKKAKKKKKVKKKKKLEKKKLDKKKANPSFAPSNYPSLDEPTSTPSYAPTNVSSNIPSDFPSFLSIKNPSDVPSHYPSNATSNIDSNIL